MAFGWDVASAGDVDGDGYADVLVGAGADAGQAYLYRGGATGLSSSPTTFDDDAGEFGSSVVCAGDVDGDGYADVLIRSSSRVYLYHGGAGGLSPAMLLRDSIDGYAGVSVDTAGDVNGDGYADVIVGGYMRSSDDGRGYLYKGGASGLSSSPAVLEGTDPGGGPLRGAVAGAGDVEGDGYADFVISGTGGFYLFRGSSTGVAGTPVVLTP